MKPLIWYKHFLLCVTASILTIATPAFAEDGQDHPMVNRYPDTKIAHYDYKEFEEAQILLSKPYEANGKWVADKVLPLEGQVTYIHYTKPNTVSALQIFRNYQTSLTKSGFKELFVCNRPCTTANIGEFEGLLKARGLYLNYSTDNQYVAAQKGNVYVSMFVNDGGVWLFVVEQGQMDTGKIKVNGNSPIANALSQSGRVDVYGLTFDTGKSSLKPSSKTTLTELSQILNDNPQLNLDVIGHTDNVGSEESNLKLSQDRSEAVIAALASDYGINPTRLNPIGKGQSQPISSNDTEKGKATNRRVEFVVQTGSVTQTAVTNEKQSQQTEEKPKEKEKKKEKVDVDKAIDTAKKIRSLF
jgi:outer membrane protein OmpA-like peptidoglycan-associated protein